MASVAPTACSSSSAATHRSVTPRLRYLHEEVHEKRRGDKVPRLRRGKAGASRRVALIRAGTVSIRLALRPR